MIEDVFGVAVALAYNSYRSEGARGSLLKSGACGKSGSNVAGWSEAL